jgi:hypothetical protein
MCIFWLVLTFVRISTCGAIFHPYSSYWTIGIFPPKRAVQNRFISYGTGLLVLLLSLTYLLRLLVSSNRVGDYEEDRESHGCDMSIYSLPFFYIAVLLS